jgi:hypothetical protein
MDASPQIALGLCQMRVTKGGKLKICAHSDAFIHAAGIEDTEWIERRFDGLADRSTSGRLWSKWWDAAAHRLTRAQ